MCGFLLASLGNPNKKPRKTQVRRLPTKQSAGLVREPHCDLAVAGFCSGAVVGFGAVRLAGKALGMESSYISHFDVYTDHMYIATVPGGVVLVSESQEFVCGQMR